MKQHITLEQLNELDDVAMRKLAEYKGLEEFDKTTMEVWRKSDNEWETVHLLINIGQMIELLDDKEVFGSFDRLSVNEFILNDGPNSIRGSEPCDILWKAVKSILEK